MEKDLIKRHLKILLIIYAVLGVMFFTFYFILDKLPSPYQKRVIPMEVTPWLR